jgi:V8-like Glu-specific endopeptidase
MSKFQVLTAQILVSWLTIFAPASKAAVINNSDLRMLMEDMTFESFSAGALVNTGHTCTVTMVSLRLGVTNRHCFVNPETNAIVPELRGVLVRSEEGSNHGVVAPTGPRIGPAVAVGHVRVGRKPGQAQYELQSATNMYEIRDVWWGPSGETKDDWAVVLFDRSRSDKSFPGERFETFRLADSSSVSSVQLISHAGYSELFVFSQGRGHTQHDCHLISRNGDVLLHDCANSRGASGGPLWLSGTNWLIGINAFQTCPREFAQNDEQCTRHGLTNGAVPVEQFRGVVVMLMAEGN